MTRILILEPGDWGDPLCGHLQVRNPLNAEYESISYTWGPAMPTETILLSSEFALSPRHTIQIRDNLATCLRYLRLPEQIRHLWVDALCISQTDVEEKNHQVANIGRIFREANRVLAWVGLPTPASEAILLQHTPKTKTHSRLRKLLSHTKRSVEESESARMIRVLDLGQREYWSRTWVIQELTLAQEVTVVCGRYRLAWDEVLSHQGGIYPNGPIATIGTLRSEFQQFGQLLKSKSLLEICSRFQYSRCSDPRDKVYALLQMSLVRDRIPPDYSKPVQLLFLDVLAADYLNLESGSFEDDQDKLNMVEVLARNLGLARYSMDNQYTMGLLERLQTDLSERYQQETHAAVTTIIQELLVSPFESLRISDSVSPRGLTIHVDEVHCSKSLLDT